MSSNGRSSGGRGGRGTGNNRSRKGNRSGNANKTKKTLQEHIYHLGTASQASDYVTITDFILNHIKKTYVNGDDIADAIEAGEEPNFTEWRPQRERSVSTDPDVQQMEDEDLMISYKLELQSFIKRRDTYKSNRSKAYGLFFGQCAKKMQNKILQRTDYAKTIKGNAIELLKVIKQEALNFQESQFPMAYVDYVTTIWIQEWAMN